MASPNSNFVVPLVFVPSIWQAEPMNPPGLNHGVTIIGDDGHLHVDREDNHQVAPQAAANYVGPSRLGSGHPSQPQALDSKSRTAFPPALSKRNPPLRGPLVGVDPHFVFSPHYAGDRNSKANQSADIPDAWNCSVFIRGLPPTCSARMLLQMIRGSGTKIYALHINPPDASNPRHCAAKLVFYQRCGVDWLFAQIRRGRFVIHDGVREYRPNAVLNKIRTAPQSQEDAYTRVVVVTGPPSVVDISRLHRFFKDCFHFDEDQAITTVDLPHLRTVEFHFSSVRCQSTNAVKFLGIACAHETSAP